ncbi:PREDICTED: uncharacterized protein LOC104823587 [Tarenaya hassleriana]|uniref:uncharacterized protein LOC104823587 n=1 Tax=Tarenaya hassleriana TaxID=28532 RepID=UPI00053C56E2|nr:PREDICTED: uncharacterized protein LOC104823587 [Tarenaya hassleriana]
MEKKGSPRSTGHGIIQRSPFVYEKYKAGCAWRLINLFDFRQGWSGKRLVSDKSHGFRDSAGNVYTKSQLDLIRRLHEKCQCTNNVNAEIKTKRRSSVSGTKHDKSCPKSVREISDREVRRAEYLKDETFDSLIQTQGKVVISERKKESSLSEIVKLEEKTDEKKPGLKKGRDQRCKNMDSDSDKCPEINLHVRVNEALICQKAKNGKVLGRDRSKQFLEALDVVSSNKELFVTLLQDPNSFSGKCGKDLMESLTKAESYEARMKERGESEDDLDRIVLLKPRLTSSDDDSSYLRFRHLTKKLKLVVGSNKNNGRENKLLRAICIPEDSCEDTETEATKKWMEKTSDETDSRRRPDDSSGKIGHGISEFSVFKRKKRVESDVFRLSPENDVSPRRFNVERRHERTISSPVYEVPHALSSFERLRLEKQSFRLRIPGKNGNVFNPKQDYHLRSFGECVSEKCRGSASYSNPRPDMEDECMEQRFSRSSCEDHSINLETRTLFSGFSSPERSNSNTINDLKQEQEHPSPVSVLARIHMEDDTTSPGNSKHASTEEQIGFSSDPRIDLKSIFSRGSVQEFVKIVLNTSGLNWTELLVKCSVSSLETSLLDQFSSNSNNSNKNDHHHGLFLDYTSEILHEIYRNDIKSWPFTPLKNPKLTPLDLRTDLVDHAMKRFDWSLVCNSGGDPRTLEQLMEKDLTKPCSWMDWGGETECVVSDLVEQILEQLEIEISTELGTMPTRLPRFLPSYSTFL